MPNELSLDLRMHFHAYSSLSYFRSCASEKKNVNGVKVPSGKSVSFGKKKKKNSVKSESSRTAERRVINKKGMMEKKVGKVMR